jgi:hypothetical protein
LASVAAITAPTPAARHRRGTGGYPRDCVTYESASPSVCPSAWPDSRHLSPTRALARPLPSI